MEDDEMNDARGKNHEEPGKEEKKHNSRHLFQNVFHPIKHDVQSPD